MFHHFTWPLLLSVLLGVCGGDSGLLDSVIIVTRHGVRSQFVRPGVCDPTEFTDGSIKFVPPQDWGTTKPGMLTPHGYAVVKMMGAYQGWRYMKALNLPSESCSPRVLRQFFVYTDQDQRDVETARAFFQGFHPTCSEKVIANMQNNKAKMKPLIDQGAHLLGEGCDLGTEDEVRGRWQDLESLKRLLKPQFEKLSETIGCCKESVCDRLKSPFKRKGKCSFLDIGWAWEKAWFNTFKGPLYCAKWYSEWFLLTYLNGMDFAGGKLTEEEMLWLSVFVTKNRELEFDVIAAKAHGSTLLSHIVMSMEQRVSGRTIKGLDHTRSTKLLYYGAHDTNVLYLKELLGLSWLSEGWQKDHTPPGGHIAFELHRKGSYSHPDNYWVSVFFDVQTPQQIRNASKLGGANKPSRNPLTIPGCSMPNNPENPLRCPWLKFKEIALQAIEPTCVFPRDDEYGVSGYVETQLATYKTLEGFSESAFMIWVLSAAAGSCTIVLVLCGVYTWRKMDTREWAGDGLGGHTRLPTEDPDNIAGAL